MNGSHIPLLASRFSPRNISGLQLWLDATDGASITLDGSGNVSQWNDKSDNGRNVAQSISGDRPAYLTGSDANSINGRPVLSSDFAVVKRLVLLNTNMLNNKTGATLFSVFRQVAGSAVASGPFNCYYGSNNTDRRFTTQVSSNNVAVRKSAGTADSTVTTTITNGVVTRLWARLNLGTAVFDANVNGVATTGTSPAAGTYSSDGDSIQILCQGNQVWRAYTGEILFYDRPLSGSEITLIENYFRSKWGTP
ncbi:hypothetical protein GC170_14535 [bacterium]|nr:hypothetical protein [bacterium]